MKRPSDNRSAPRRLTVAGLGALLGLALAVRIPALGRCWCRRRRTAVRWLVAQAATAVVPFGFRQSLVRRSVIVLTFRAL